MIALPTDDDACEHSVATNRFYYIWRDFSILVSILWGGDNQPLFAYA
jgi:hypothetical protein